MKVDMSAKAIENRLKLVGELTKACLLIRRNSLEKNKKEAALKKNEDYFSIQTEKKQP
jgi:hypothetical protein